jgi:hypothetical protein
VTICWYWCWCISRNNCSSSVLDISNIASFISVVVDSLETTIRKVDIVAALGVVSISIFIVAKVQTGIVILDSIGETVDSWAIIDWLTIGWGRCIGRDWDWSWLVDRCWSIVGSTNDRSRSANNGSRSANKGSGSNKWPWSTNKRSRASNE